jgi:hypothetical protein
MMYDIHLSQLLSIGIGPTMCRDIITLLHSSPVNPGQEQVLLSMKTFILLFLCQVILQWG